MKKRFYEKTTSLVVKSIFKKIGTCSDPLVEDFDWRSDDPLDTLLTSLYKVISLKMIHALYKEYSGSEYLGETKDIISDDENCFKQFIRKSLIHSDGKSPVDSLTNAIITDLYYFIFRKYEKDYDFEESGNYYEIFKEEFRDFFLHKLK